MTNLFRRTAHAAAFFALVTLSVTASAQSAGALRVGAARADITPPQSADYVLPSGKFDHERLYARAIVLDNGQTRAALITADLGGLGEDVWRDTAKPIADLLHCPVENIVMSAIHSHSGPTPWRGMAGANAPDPTGAAAKARQAFIDKLMAAVTQAQSRLEPARVGFGRGSLSLNVNRDTVDRKTHLWTQAPNPDALSDKTVAVLKFERPNGELIAAYVNYAMHPINGYVTALISADFPGAMSRYVEQEFGDKAVVAFSQGASGDQNPLYLRASTNVMASRDGLPIPGYSLTREPVEAPLREPGAHPMPSPKAIETLERWMDAEGLVLGEEVIRVLTETTQTSGDVRLWAVQTMLTCPGRNRTDAGREGMTATYVDGAPVNLRLGLLGIGDIALGSVDAEIYTKIGLRLKKQSPLNNTMLVTIANGAANSGYVPDDESFGHNSFQVLGSRLKPGCAENGIADGITNLINQYTHAAK